MKRKLLIFLLCLALLPAVPAASAGSGWGAATAEWSVELAEGAALTGNTYWTGTDALAEHYLELSPGGAVTARVNSGDVLCENGSMTDRAAALEEAGTRVLAGVNGGYYTFSTREPVGLVMQNGILRSDDEGLYAVGFRADGSVLIGQPELKLTLEIGGEFYSLDGLNRTRGADGFALFTEDFDEATHAAGTGWNLVCVPEGDLAPGGTVALAVESVSADAGGVPIPEGRMVLSFGWDTEQEAPEWLAAIAPGDELTLTVGCADGWEDVTSAVGILYPLLVEGQVQEKLETAAAPRSAIGVRADGTLVLYTVDGRQSGYSAGAGLDAVAARMKELGCVAAGALDGGASTNLSAALPGDDTLAQVNRPSGGNPRKVVNYIFLTTEEPPVGKAERLALYPLRVDALAGAEIELNAKAADRWGYAATLPEELTYSVSNGLGRVEDGVFVAENAGTGTITVSAEGVESTSIPVNVAASPDTIEIYGEVYGRRITTITLAPEQEVDFTAKAWKNHTLLIAEDECFTWEIDPEAGEIDETGHLICAGDGGSGTLRVSVGKTVREATVKILPAIPFEDVAVSDPYYTAVKYAYQHGLFEGTGDTTFDPEIVMNRGMLVTVLWRMEGEPEAEAFPAFEDVLPEDWFGPAVAWAAETGLVKGYSETEFGPWDDLTKEQIITILHRYAGEPEASNAGLGDYADAPEAGWYAYLPLSWAAAAGIVEADENANLLPRAPMTRAAVAEVLMRYLELPEETEENETEETESDSPLG